jgi:hypothetical protein
VGASIPRYLMFHIRWINNPIRDLLLPIKRKPTVSAPSLYEISWVPFVINKLAIYCGIIATQKYKL